MIIYSLMDRLYTPTIKFIENLWRNSGVFQMGGAVLASHPRWFTREDFFYCISLLWKQNGISGKTGWVSLINHIPFQCSWHWPEFQFLSSLFLQVLITQRVYDTSYIRLRFRDIVCKIPQRIQTFLASVFPSVFKNSLKTNVKTKTWQCQFTIGCPISKKTKKNSCELAHRLKETTF